MTFGIRDSTAVMMRIKERRAIMMDLVGKVKEWRELVLGKKAEGREREWKRGNFGETFISVIALARGSSYAIERRV